MEGSSPPERAAAAGSNNDRGSVRYGVGVDDEWEHQPVCDSTPGCEPIQPRKFSI